MASVWECCPRCNGEGVVYVNTFFNPMTTGYEGCIGNQICPVCNGHKVISKINGKPPQIDKAEIDNISKFETPLKI